MHTPKQARKLTPRRLMRLTLCLIMTAAILLCCTQCKSDPKADPTEKGKKQPAAATQTDPLTFVDFEIPDDGTDGFLSTVDEGVYIYHNMTFELCGASDDAAEDYASAISEFKQSAPNVTVYNLVAPTHTEYGLPTRLSTQYYSTSQKQNIQKIYTSYTQDVQPINCYNTLADHRNEYIYFNTDHHWTGLGAYYAYRAFCEQTGQTPLDLNTCTENRIEGFAGSFSDCADSLDIDYVSYWTLPYATHAMRQSESGGELYEASVYEDYCEGTAAYITFIGGDASEFIAYNDTNNNGKKIAVVKESYGNAFVPYLTYNYGEVHVLDLRYFSGSVKSYLEENGITEILFLNNIMSANNPFQTDYIRNNL